MNHFSRISSVLLIVCLAATLAFAQQADPKPAPKEKSQPEPVKNEQVKTDESAEDSWLARWRRATRENDDWDADLRIDIDPDIEVVFEKAMESLEVVLGNLELDMEALEHDLAHMDVEIEPIEVDIPDLDIHIEPIDIEIPELDIDIDIEPIDIDMEHIDIDDVDVNVDIDEETSFRHHWHDKHDKDSRPKDKEKEKSDEKADDKSKGLKKIN